MRDDAFASANLLERIGHLSRADDMAGDLYPAQWAALRYLARANRFSRTPMALSRYLGTTRGTTSQTVLALERKGYVKREPSPRDRRSVDLTLTRKGKARLDKDPILGLGSAIESSLGTQSGRLQVRLEQVLEVLLRNNGGRKFGACRTCRHFVEGEGGREGHYCGLLKVPLAEEEIGKICVEQE